MDEIRCQIAVLGGSLGGVAAALAAARAGRDVCLFSETNWIGGQLTSQGVCTTDDNQWIETVGSTASYRELRQIIRQYYTSNFHLSTLGRRLNPFNPGDCWVSEGFSTEPKVALDALREMLQRFSNLNVFQSASVVNCTVDTVALRIQDVEVRLAERDQIVRVVADYYLDATDLGDVLPLTDVEYTIGAESRSDTGEPDAPQEAHPERVQPFTFVFALERRPENEQHTITPPNDYTSLKALQNYGLRDGAINGMFTDLGLWSYRRIISRVLFHEPDRIPCDLSTINTDSNDFKGGIIPTGNPQQDAHTLYQGRRASLGYAYWLQQECPRDEGSAATGYANLKLRTDLFDTDDGIALQPYIRESRRMRALVTVVEQDIASKFNSGPRARLFSDSCGIGHYTIDIHKGPNTDFFSLETKPFQIPMGSLISKQMINLLAASKNLGVTHITNGAYRVHPIEWNVGESAGALAAFCLAMNVEPRDVHANRPLLREYQRSLLEAGIPLFWWSDVPREHNAFVATQLLGITEIFRGGFDLRFRPADLLTAVERQAIEQRLGRPLAWPNDMLTRGEAARWLAEELGLLP